MTSAAKWLRRFEIALALAGLSFLGGAFAATVGRWNYQAHQERAMVASERTIPPPRQRSIPPPRENFTLPSRENGPISPPRQNRPIPPPTADEAVDPLVLGRIEIPRLGVRAVMREGVDEATLAVAVGHVPGTARLGESGNTVLAGHRDTFFRPLRNIRVNDRIRLVVPRRAYDYRVISLKIVAPDDIGVLDPTPDEEVTLVTCYPFHYIGPSPNRFIVRAARVK